MGRRVYPRRPASEAVPPTQQPQSDNGLGKEHRDTLRSLGLKRIGQTVEKEDRPEIRGMVKAVRHLVTVEEVD